MKYGNKNKERKTRKYKYGNENAEIKHQNWSKIRTKVRKK
jgi:hypothetical protein